MTTDTPAIPAELRNAVIDLATIIMDRRHQPESALPIAEDCIRKLMARNLLRLPGDAESTLATYRLEHGCTRGQREGSTQFCALVAGKDARIAELEGQLTDRDYQITIARAEVDAVCRMLTEKKAELERLTTPREITGTHYRNGGLARAASLSPERRSEIARIAAAKRWGKAS